MTNFKVTTDYGKFRFIKSNRPVSRQKALRLAEEIKKFGYQESSPILVTYDYRIIDGQHRFTACKMLGIPVNYVVSEETNESEILNLMISLNKSQSVWRLEEYIKHFAKIGIGFHSEVNRINEEFKIGMSSSISICAGKTGASPAKIRNGENIKLNPKRYEIIDFLKKCKHLPFVNKMYFVRAVVVMFNKANDYQIGRLEKKILLIPECASLEAYLTVFENIINKGITNGRVKF